MSSPLKRPVVWALVFVAFMAPEQPVTAQPPQVGPRVPQDQVPLPPAVEPILIKATAAIKSNFRAFEKTNQRPLDDARTSLGNLVTSLNQAKQVQQAAAVQNLLNDVQAVVFERAGASDLNPAPQPAAPQAVVPAVPPVPMPQGAMPLLEKLRGSWSHPKFWLLYEFAENGAFTETNRATGQKNAGKAVDKGGGVVHVDVNQHLLEVTMAGEDRIAVLVWDPNKEPLFTGLVLTRQQPDAEQAPAPGADTPKPGD